MLVKSDGMGGSIYGSKTIESEETVRETTKIELKIARRQGEIFVKVVKIYHWGSLL
jgi:hypothetical protein